MAIERTSPLELTGVAAAARLWASLDKPWHEAFRQAWEALRSGNIAVGACASTPDGKIVRSARNRVRSCPRHSAVSCDVHAN